MLQTQGAFRDTILFLITCLLSVIVGQAVIGVLSNLLFGDWAAIAEVLNNVEKYDGGQIKILLIQGVSSTFIFILPAVIFIFYLRKVDLNLQKNAAALYGLVLAILFFSIPLISELTIWNRAIILPEFLSEFEQWAIQSEEQYEKVTKYMLDMDGFGHFLLALLVVGVLPAVGEELVFRGVLQQLLIRGFRNPHIGILIASILFSAIHFSFYGFVPRLILGMTFGYMFYFSGNIMLPILAHFINNALIVILIYMHDQGHIDFDVQAQESTSFISFLTFTILFGLSFFYFIKHCKTEST